MEIGLIGLGKMGANLAINLKKNGFDVKAYDINSATYRELNAKGIVTGNSIEEMIGSMNEKKIIWMMVPAGNAVDDTIQMLMRILMPGDIIIDGGNSNYKDSIRRASFLSEVEIEYLDCGTSGGVSGALEGVCAMVGGAEKTFRFVEPVFKAIAVNGGYHHCGPAGAGHFAKMVHNGIEYGMMQSIAEGFEMMQQSEFNYDHEAIARLWNNGSVIRGWLMELTAKAFSKDINLEKIKGIVHSSGEGKWMVEAALEKGVCTPVIALSLLMRYRSQQQDTFAGKVVAALRHEFGGHAVNKNPGKTGL